MRLQKGKEEEGFAVLWVAKVYGTIALIGVMMWVAPGPAGAAQAGWEGKTQETIERLTQERHHQAIQKRLSSRVYLITLEDGTRCAVLYERDSYGGTGGIDCDWDWRDRAETLSTPPLKTLEPLKTMDKESLDDS